MDKTVDDQIINQVKKLQARLIALEAKGAEPVIDDLKVEIENLKNELIELKKPKAKKIDFGEW